MGRKHVPLRTCIMCRQTHPKRELVRIVRTPTGGVMVDEKGKMPGRGAYICRSVECWQKALSAKNDRLSSALKTTLTEQETGMLKEYAASMVETRGREAERE